MGSVKKTNNKNHNDIIFIDNPSSRLDPKLVDAAVELLKDRLRYGPNSLNKEKSIRQKSKSKYF